MLIGRTTISFETGWVGSRTPIGLGRKERSHVKLDDVMAGAAVIRILIVAAGVVVVMM